MHFADRAERHRADDRPRLQRRPIHVLVAEDDPDLLALVAEGLREAGFIVTELTSGHELASFLELLELDPDVARPDVVVSDVRMPGLSGLEALASLRSAEWSTPVILITAFRDPATCELAASYEATCVLAKPFELAELASVIVAASAGGPGP